MKIKKINENPTISDVILLEIETPNALGCFDIDPYKVENLTIYYVEVFDIENLPEEQQKVVLFFLKNV